RPVRVAWTYCHPDTIDELLPEAARMPVPIRLPPPATTPPTETLGDPARGATPDAATGGTVVPRLSYSALALYDRCGYRFYLQRVLGLADVEPPLSATTPARRGLSPLERGNLAHLLLEQVDLARPQLPTGDEIATLAHANGLVCGRDDAADLLTLLERFFDSRLSARLASATSARREAPFVFSLDPDQPRSPLIVGALDVLARERGGAVLVVDYKTDTLDGTDPATLVVRHYAFQQTVYALAALRAGAVDVEVAHCFLERPDDPVCVSYRAADDATLSAVLRARADGIAAQRFAPTARPHRALCATCPGRAALCSWSEQRTLADDPGAAE
ncbi:MAG TPA: PD-(D/E)XK nuclease family protein, partial [Solirubrobacteraceae bacterium]|nr:PD-(D/E)XK nuclease family protein [Solirubrobacteraceae bacterium]